MRVLLIIITLLGGAVFGYSLTGRVHYAASHSDLLTVLYPKEGSSLPKEQLETLRTQLAAQESAQQTDWRVVRFLGGAVFLLGFAALIYDRRKHGSRVAA
jgi:hypothetical protein